MTATTPKQDAITVANWQDSANLPWSFLHMAELFPTEAIRSGEAKPPVELKHKPSSLHALAVGLPDGTNTTVADILESTNTDAWMVLKDDMVLAEQYFGSMQPSTPHLLMSVSKSIVSTVVGVLVDEGKIDPEQNIEHYIPELSGSGYRGASVRDILDMRSGIKFSEDYLDPGSEVRQLDEAVGWAPRRHGNATTLKQFLMSLEKARDHGGPFQYRSCETDVLGWLCEAVSGRRSRSWRPNFSGRRWARTRMRLSPWTQKVRACSTAGSPLRCVTWPCSGP
ncbi:serine hydrolase [Arthrobacter sp. SIMBA_036]|uniref:serine hydrolase domain-containing protein n=1 Tax=Arthrobacter sp. SIMBA_036 TaxID=3085778 RepID=UPI003977F19C